MFLIYFPFTLRGKKNPFNFLTLRLLVIETIQGSLACMHLSLGEYILNFLRKKEVFSSQDVSSTVLFVIWLIQLIFHWGYSANKAQSVEDEVKSLPEECEDIFLLHSAGAHSKETVSVPWCSFTIFFSLSVLPRWFYLYLRGLFRTWNIKPKILRKLMIS